MEDRPDMEEKKRPLTDKERKAAQREREKAIANGTYVKTPIEQAKEFLAAQSTPDITVI
jgi:hypothetical protein